MQNHKLIHEVSTRIRAILLDAEKLRAYSNDLLLRHPANNGWSAAQCLQHMNVYSDYYLPAIESALSKHPELKSSSFSPGMLGAWFTGMMKTDESGLVKKKMKSPKNAFPDPQPDAAKELAAFISHQHHLLNLLQVAAQSDLNKIRVPISIARFIRMKLGDVFLFFTAHEERHMLQLKRALAH